MSGNGSVVPYLYKGVQVRLVEEGKEVWLCANDVCNAVGLGNVSMAVGPLDADEKGIKKFDTLGGPQEMLAVNESGLYTLLIRSNKAEAKPFRRWVTHEVLPSIRKTGRFEVKPLGPLDILKQQVALLEDQERRLAVVNDKADQAMAIATAVEQRHQQTQHNIEQAHRLAKTAVDIHSSNYGFYTVLAWCSLKDYPCDYKLASVHGRRLTKICRAAGIATGSVKDARWGQVHTYPEDVLERYFN
jgi:prophage antirepressor-like protein